MLMKDPIEHLVQFRIVNVMYIREQVVGNVVVESTENEIRAFTEWMHVVRAFDLIHHPRSFNVATLINRWVFNALDMVCHEEREQQK